jgi:hypothetical protein
MAIAFVQQFLALQREADFSAYRPEFHRCSTSISVSNRIPTSTYH